MENRIAELKHDLGADGFCLQQFFATEAAFRAVLLLFNLLSEFQRAAGLPIYRAPAMGMEITPPKRRGRPPEGLGKKGEPERIRDYPRQLFTMRPATVARLKAIAQHENRAEWRVVEDSVVSYYDNMTPKDRRAVDAIVRARGDLVG